MKIEFQTGITKLSETQFGVAVTAILPTADQAVEVRKWIEGALANAAKHDQLLKGNTLLLPPGWVR